MRSLLQGERCRLTALESEDMATMALWQRDDRFLRLFDAAPAIPKTAAQLQEWLKTRHDDPASFIFALRPVESNDLIGILALDGILWTHRTAWLSIAIGDPTFRGRGYGSEGVRLLLSFAFQELNLHRVQLTVFSYNNTAIAVYKRLGFRHEGTYRQAILRHGQRHDMLLFGLLHDEWIGSDAR